jgi:hypothetical protein
MTWTRAFENCVTALSTGRRGTSEPSSSGYAATGCRFDTHRDRSLSVRDPRGDRAAAGDVPGAGLCGATGQVRHRELTATSPGHAGIAFGPCGATAVPAPRPSTERARSTTNWPVAVLASMTSGSIRDPHGHRHAHRELLPRRERRCVPAGARPRSRHRPRRRPAARRSRPPPGPPRPAPPPAAPGAAPSPGPARWPSPGRPPGRRPSRRTPPLHGREPGHDVDQRHPHHQRDEPELHQRRPPLAVDLTQPPAQPVHAPSFTARPVTSSRSRFPSEASLAGTEPEQHHHERQPAAPAPHPSRPGTPNPTPVRSCTGHARRRRHQAPRPPPPLRHPRTQTPNAAVVLGDGEGGHEFAGGETTASASRCRKSPAQREPPPVVVSLAARRRRWRPIRAVTVGSLSRPRPAASLVSGGGDATWTWSRSSGGDQGGIRSASEESCTTRQGWGSRCGPSPDRVS